MSHDPLGRLRDDLQTQTSEKSGARIFLLVDPANNTSHELGEIEHSVATLMDGLRSAGDIMLICAHRGLPVSTEQVRKVHLELAGMGLLGPPRPPVELAPTQAGPSPDISRFVKQASDYMGAGRFDLAKGLFEAALEIDDSDPDALVGFTRCCKMLAAAEPKAAAPDAQNPPSSTAVAAVTPAPRPGSSPPGDASQARAYKANRRPRGVSIEVSRAPGRSKAGALLLGAVAIGIGVLLVRVFPLGGRGDDVPDPSQPLLAEAAPVAAVPPSVAPPVVAAAPPVVAAAPPVAPPVVSPDPSLAPLQAAVDTIVHPVLAEVTSPLDGKFMKVSVPGGKLVRKGAKILLMANKATGEEASVMSPASGAFYAAVSLGTRLKTGEIVATIVDPLLWHVTARFDDDAASTLKGCKLQDGARETKCQVVAVTPLAGGSVLVVAAVTGVAAPWLTGEAKAAIVVLSPE